ncbi:hypothetical protein E6C55_13560 [Cohnella fermenti]|uniref:Arabinogalactan endo-beta-1,4-galactanase n=2 Tax=Cohnella fermenti TaxID=2565925 RepID=A0A4S4BUG6_9BACL|nr:hypothetical protein E6C55_13560 [Cohnella fermenti]
MATVLLVSGVMAAFGTAAREADASAIANLVLNPGFETGDLEGWTYEGPASTLSVSGSDKASGSYAASFWNASAYQFTLTQTLTGLEDGEYVLKAYASGNAGTQDIRLFADGFGGDRLETAIANTGWGNVPQYVVSGIQVTNGTATLGFSADVPAGYWGFFDDVEFYRTGGSTAPVTADEFIKGADISTLQAIEDAGGHYYEDGTEKDLLAILKDHGVNYIRLRLWNDPVEAGGYNDKAHTLEMAKRVKEAGLKLLLDFHYSDFWADPGKQVKPAAWQSLSYDELKQAVYDYTADVLNDLADENAYPDMVQIGNEINPGMLLPDGSVSNYDKLAGLLTSGTTAVRDTTPDGQKAKIMIHLAEGGNNSFFQTFFNAITARGVDFDVIGMSYYPFWHGNLQQLKTNLNDMAARFGKQVVVAETSYGYTLADGDGWGNTFTQTEVNEAGFPATVEGQKTVVETVLNTVAHVPNGLGLGAFYWEPAWIPVPKDGNGHYRAGWKEGEGNAWDNQAMFDFAGNALDSLDAFRFDMASLPAEQPLMAYAPEGITVEANTAVEAATAALPAAVDVLYNEGTIRAAAVVWDSLDEDLLSKVGTFELSGTVEGSEATVSIAVTVSAHRNVLVNPGFEDGNTGWTIEGTSGAAVVKTDSGNAYAGSKALNYYSDGDFVFTLTQTLTDLPNGTYVLKAKVSGGGGDNSVKLFASAAGAVYESGEIVNTGWKVWNDATLTGIEVTDHTASVGLAAEAPAGTWGWVDSFELYREVDLAQWETAKSLTASETTADSIKLAWSGVKEPGNVQGYRVYQDGVRIATVTEAVYTATGLEENTAYTFKIEASNDGEIWTSDGPSATLSTSGEGTEEPGTDTPGTSPGTTTDGTTTPAVPEGTAVLTAADLKGEAQSGTVAVKLPDGATSVQLPASASQLLAGKPLELISGGIVLRLPADVLKELEDKLGAEGVITVQMKPLGEEARKAVLAKLNGQAGTTVALLGDVCDFELTIASADGKSQQSLTQFSVPIGLRFAADQPSATAGIFFLNAAGEPEYVGGKWKSGYYEAELSHFSRYALLDVEKTFADVKTTHWAYGSIRELAAKQVVLGVSADRFEPSRTITRAEFTAMLARALGLAAGDPAASGFADVPASAWYAADVAAAAERGIVSGRGDGSFDPSGAITREEMAVMAAKAAAALLGDGEVKAAEGDEADAAVFADSLRISAWAEASVGQAVRLKLMQGRGSNLFAPQGIVTRAEAAELLSRLLGTGNE